MADNFDKPLNDAIRAMVGQLQNLRKSIRQNLLNASDPLAQSAINDTIAEINELVSLWQSSATADTRTALQSAFEGGLIDATPEGLGIPSLVTSELLQTMLDFSADLIQGVADDMRVKISTRLRLAAMGDVSLFQTMKDISSVLGVKTVDGVWGLFNRPDVVQGVAARAEAILRTELTRMYSQATIMRGEQISELYPDLSARKWWDATSDNRTRPTHRAAGNTYGPDNAIPIDQPFIVGGVEMKQPGDPSAPGRETINCRCRLRIVYVE